jgi:hypothetical protein
MNKVIFLFFLWGNLTNAFCQNLIQNGDFSTPNANWITGGNDFYWGNNAENCYRSATAYAWFSDPNGTYQNHNNVSGWIYQEFVVPQNIANAYLDFYASINTYDSDAFPYDSLLVQLWNQSNVPVATIMLLSNENGSQSLICQPYLLKQEVNKISTALATRGGQTLRLAFKAINDFSSGTIFRIDDVSLTYTLGCALPLAPGVPQGEASVCEGETQFYSINPLSGTNTYTWSVTNGTIVNQNNTVVEVLWDNIGSGSVSVYATNLCGDGPGSPVLIVSINQPPTISVMPSSPSFCQGQGSAVLTASGAASYLWSNGAQTSQTSIQAGGLYSVTGTISGCSTIEYVFVAENTPPAVAVNAVPNTPVAPNTQVSLSVTPANAVNYQWNIAGVTGSNPTVEPTTNTTYIVTATDANGCSGTGSVTVVVIQSPQCDNSTAILSNSSQNFSSAGGIDSFTVTFTPAASGCMWGVNQNNCSWISALQPTGGQTQNGNVVFTVAPNTGSARTCTLQVNSGNNTYDFIIEQDSAVNNCNNTLQPPVITDNGNCILEAEEIADVTYQWYLFGNILQGDTSRFHTATQTGDYSVVITDSNNCTAQSAGLYMDCLPVGLITNEFISDIVVYPNPNNGNFQIDIMMAAEKNVSIKIFNTMGHIVFEKTELFSIDNFKTTVQLSDVSKGIYFVNVQSEEQVITKRVLVAP